MIGSKPRKDAPFLRSRVVVQFDVFECIFGGILNILGEMGTSAHGALVKTEARGLDIERCAGGTDVERLAGIRTDVE